MKKKSKADYEGTYFIAKSPSTMKVHNKISWSKIETLASRSIDGIMDFNLLAAVVEDHEHGTMSAKYPYQFITYCIRSGWLVRTQR